MAFVPLAGALVLLLQGCKAHPDFAKNAQRINLKSAALSLSLPNSYTVYDLTAEDTDGSISDIQKAFPNQPELIARVQQLSQTGTMKLFGGDPQTGKQSVPNTFSLSETSVAKGTTLDSIVKLDKGRLGSIANAGSLQTASPSFDAGHAGFFEYDTSARASVTHVLYVMVHGGKEVDFDFSGPSTKKENCEALAESVLGTVHFDQ